MPKIELLSKQMAELISAGEVVERPASVIKETVENSIDAKAKHITVEIQRGGITYMRITDDGCGISYEDTPTAFLRHATSKIKTSDDLENVMTLGFRGEALAATASVSRVEMFTKQRDDELGTHYVIEGGVQTEYEQTGCPDGTTVIIRDLFYNTPARMKFLKKDSSEGNTVTAVIERVALSHPEISFKLIKDGKQTLVTSGDGKLESAVYSVLGRDIARSFTQVDDELDYVKVSGYACKPVFCRQSRAAQYTYINGRLVRSNTVMAAAEQAYKNSAMVGKFPAFVLNLSIPASTVDVNVHPSKTEVRFSDEKRIFDAVYRAVKKALVSGDTRPEIKFSSVTSAPAPKMSAEHYVQEPIRQYNETPAQRAYASQIKPVYENTVKAEPKINTDMDANTTANGAQDKAVKAENELSFMHSDNIPFFMRKDVIEQTKITGRKEPPVANTEKTETETGESVPAQALCEPQPILPEIKIIGEAFSTYIIAQKGESLFLIDKHAAHERIIFNRLKSSEGIHSQSLLEPVTVRVSAEEYEAFENNTEAVEKAGFEIDGFGENLLMVRAVPSDVEGSQAEETVQEILKNLAERRSTEREKIEKMYHTVACRAAIKAGNIISRQEMQSLAERVLLSDDIMYCPHGRPVAFEIKKRELEKQFGRIQ